MRLSGYFLAFILSATAFYSQAAPWVNTDDRYLRSSIKILADGGYLHVPVNTYPLMWQPLLQNLAHIDIASMNDSQLFAYLRLMSAADFTKQSGIKTLSIAGSNEAVSSSGFGQQYQHQAEINLSSELFGKNWAVGVSKTFSDNSHHANGFEPDNSWDGSYAAYTFGNWVVSAAQQQLWWGPGYDSSANFSNAGRPPKTLQLSRLNSNAPLMALLEPLGAVNMQLLLAEQPGSALLRHAKVLAARINIKPPGRIEFGLSASQLHSINKVAPADQQSNPAYGLSYQFPDDRINTVSIDGRYSITSNTAAYTEVSMISGEYSWLAGGEYVVANPRVQTLLVAEYKKVADDMQHWQSLQHDSPYGEGAHRWLVGIERHYRNGSSVYANLSFTKHSQNTALLAINPLRKLTKLAIGYQTELFAGLFSIDGQYSQASSDNSEAGMHIDSGSDHSIGVRWERRW